VSSAVRTSRHRMSIRQAAAIWVLVFLIGLTGGELLRQHTVDAKAVAVTSGSIEPTAATSARAVNPAVLSATSTTTTTSPPQTITAVDCDPSSCLDQAAKQDSRTEDGQGRGRSNEGKEPGRHGKGTKSGNG
jgi:hypothetical protein